MIVSLKEILKDAYQKGYAVGAFNCLSLENTIGAIKAAEELNSPIILQLAEVQFPYSPMADMAPIFLNEAKKAKVPVCVHLDHGQSYETCAKAISLGFKSVMIDGSQLSFEENIKLTASVVKMAKAFGVDVEAELGRVGDAEASNGSEETSDSDLFTGVEAAKEYVERTGIDALAIAIGNMHGKYIATPRLNIERLKEIKNNTDIPLVLHGGSGTSDEDFKSCIHNGVSKINVATAIQLGVTEAVKKYVQNPKANYIDMKYVIANASSEVVKQHLLLFESNLRVGC